MLSTPIVLSIFNRPDRTARVFAEIARAKPKTLFVIADGPRADRAGETELCAATRAVTEKIDWPCELVRDYSEPNLGNRVRIATGYSNVFEQVDEAIFLEDDCLPHPTFFPYCEALLDHHRHDERIMTVSGDNFQFGKRVTPLSYYFSLYPHLWGFATWKRAWKYYDPDIKAWPALRETTWLLDIVGCPYAVKWWVDVFDRLHDGSLQTWDSQWAFACWINSALSCAPAVNLISNIGFGETANSTTDTSNPTNQLPVEAMEFPLQHPPMLLRDFAADRRMFDHIFAPVVIPKRRTFLQRVKGKVKRIIRR